MIAVNHSNSKNSPLASQEHNRIVNAFPDNPHVLALMHHAVSSDIAFRSSPLKEQWLYNPKERAIYVWEPDLTEQSLSFLVVILAHEMGHAIDFDRHPHHREIVKNLHYAEVPAFIEIRAFIEGYKLIQHLNIPITPDQYEQMIDPSIADIVKQAIDQGSDYNTPSQQKKTG